MSVIRIGRMYTVCGAGRDALTTPYILYLKRTCFHFPRGGTAEGVLRAVTIKRAT